MVNSIRSGALYDAISAANEERIFEHWHASSISECPRSHYLKRLGQKPINVPNAAKLLRFQAGHIMEEFIRPFIQKVYGETESNVRATSEGLDMTGEWDNLTVKDHRLVEIKSIHDNAFIDKDGQTGLKEETGELGPRGGKGWRIKPNPYLNHQLQQHCYVLLLKEREIEVTNIDYIYISLSGRLAAYSTKTDPQLIEAVKRRLAVLNEAWRTKTPPPCICKDYDNPLYSEVLQYCNYKNESTGECCELKV